MASQLFVARRIFHNSQFGNLTSCFQADSGERKLPLSPDIQGESVCVCVCTRVRGCVFVSVRECVRAMWVYLSLSAPGNKQRHTTILSG